MKFIDLDRQYRRYRGEIDAAVKQVLESGQFIMGEAVARIEQELSGFTGARHAIATSSGTDGLLLCLMAEEVMPGDEIITTPFTFIATAEVIVMRGAVPVFADIEPDTFNISPASVEEKIHQRRRAGARLRGIIPVSLYGHCPDMDQINHLAQEAGLFVIEDACQSLGAEYMGRKSCALSRYGVTSFFPSKPLGCYGDGGMIFTDRDHLAEKLRAMRVHGQTERYVHAMPGINGRLDAIQAAILSAKLPHFEQELEARNRAAGLYAELLREKAPDIVPPVVRPGCTSVFAQYTVRIPGGKRDAAVRMLREAGIPCAIHYPIPVHRQEVFSCLDIPAGAFPEAEKAAGEVLSLPMHPFITPDEQEQVVDTLKRI